MSETSRAATIDDPRFDNVVWHSLTGPHSHLAAEEISSTGRARRYHRDVSVMGAVSGPVDQDAWHALAELYGPGRGIVLFRAEVDDPPEGFEVLGGWPTSQWIADGPLQDVEIPALVELGLDDVDDMLALVKLTQPGPFESRTFEMGTYLGLRRQGQLVAMAGQRFRFDGAVEISAVCTHPDAQRQGLGAALTAAVAQRIQADGETPFLHVAHGNDAAARVYEALGFRRRRDTTATAVRIPR